ncbi:hypothetical protein [Cytobacillus dafuensis]|uniref:Uncharacterized protein n=1 Tax=Cytobacillus dafuensis TaxID=1742359 RepID=A0A5B8Z5D7_CYTDA|nr:hypothetical protein [Cytobacillus dafuensis]QED48340.1 hypothetical protein FSZ17_14445 [Cytobacillus dafuensis]
MGFFEGEFPKKLGKKVAPATIEGIPREFIFIIQNGIGTLKEDEDDVVLATIEYITGLYKAIIRHGIDTHSSNGVLIVIDRHLTKSREIYTPNNIGTTDLNQYKGKKSKVASPFCFTVCSKW